MEVERKQILRAIETLETNRSWQSFANMLVMIVFIIANGAMLWRMLPAAPKDVLVELKSLEIRLELQFNKIEERQAQIQSAVLANQTALLSFVETIREFKASTNDRWTKTDQAEFSKINQLQMQDRKPPHDN